MTTYPKDLPTIIPNYKEAYKILMEYFDYIPEELREEVDERLKGFGC